MSHVKTVNLSIKGYFWGFKLVYLTIQIQIFELTPIDVAI